MESTKTDRSVKFLLDEPRSNGAVIKVIGVGGGGTNAVNRMIDAGVEAVEFIVANTDTQALQVSRAPTKLQIGAKLTNGLGAGADPYVGRSAALEDTDRIIEVLEGADMIFVAAGLGGGTGTGAAPIIANLAAELGALTVAIVTEPFLFEGKKRRVQAERGLQDIRACVDTVIAISNERLLQTVERGTSFSQAFQVADDILRQGVQGISDIIQVPGIINVDFADVKAVMQGMGRALMGTGTASGEDRAAEAAKRAIASPLLEEISIQGAKGILINITGSEELLLHEVSESASIIHEAADEDANIIFGAVIDDKINGKLLDEPEFMPFWKAAEQMGAVILFHQGGDTIVDRRIKRYHLPNSVGNLADRTLTFASLVMGGVMDACPDLRICLSHGGGFACYGAGRMDRGWERIPADDRLASMPPSKYLDRFYYDCIVYTERALRFLIDSVGIDRVLFGTDWPYDMALDWPVSWILGLESITQEEKDAILWKNLESLLGI